MEKHKTRSEFVRFCFIIVCLSSGIKGKIVEEDIFIDEVLIQTLSAYTIKTKTWVSGQVPFVLDRGLSSTALTNIQTAMQTIERKTSNCVRFFARASGNTDYINISSSNNGCYSSVGRVGGGQIINIGEGCETVGIIMHELLHALGFWHEQSRTDRDNYVDILYDNIQIDKVSEFKMRTDTTGIQSKVQYDFHSILHYKYNQFAKVKSLDTIVPKAIYSNVSKAELGQRERLSDKDVDRIKWLYDCHTASSCARPYFENVKVSPIQNSYSVGTIVAFSCLIGTLYGSKTSECMSSGQWSGETPKCMKSSTLPGLCARPNIKNVTVSPYLYTYNVGDIVKFSCTEGTLIGARTSRCMANGDWLGTKPYCVRSKGFHYCDMDKCLIDKWHLWKWKQASGSTPTLDTGPSFDHTTQNVAGKYLLMEATEIPQGQFAIAYSPSVSDVGGINVCMTFYYYMYGEGLDSKSTLYAFIDYELAWHITGSTKVGQWTQAVTKEIRPAKDYVYVVLFTRRGDGSDKADIAVDDVFIGPCDEVYQYSNITAASGFKTTEFDFFK